MFKRLLFVIFVIVYSLEAQTITTNDQISIGSSRSFGSGFSKLIFIRGGVKLAKKNSFASKKTKKLTFSFMIQSFFSSIFDPSYVENVQGLKRGEQKSLSASDKIKSL